MNNYHENCLVCGSSELNTLENFSKAFLCKCKSCSFVFSEKIPSEIELINYYNGYGRNDYLSPITIKRYHELLDKMEVFRKTNRILDVGCGIGYFLEVAIERGWEVYGTEYTDKALEICSKKGINMMQGKLDSANYEQEFFDVITSFEVIEHINNPNQEIQHFQRILRKGGLVYITTPNFNSLLRYRLKEQYNVITYPEHLSYYTPYTLNKLFSLNGLKKKKIETTGISITRLKTSQNKSNEKFVSANSADEKLRTKFENKRALNYLKNSANLFLTILGCGDSLKGWFVKI